MIYSNNHWCEELVLGFSDHVSHYTRLEDIAERSSNGNVTLLEHGIGRSR